MKTKIVMSSNDENLKKEQSSLLVLSRLDILVSRAAGETPSFAAETGPSLKVIYFLGFHCVLEHLSMWRNGNVPQHC